MIKIIDQIRRAIKAKADHNMSQYIVIDLALQSASAFEQQDRAAGKKLIEETLQIHSKCITQDFECEEIKEDLEELRKHRQRLRFPTYGQKRSQEEKMNYGIASDMCRVVEMIGKNNDLAKTTMQITLAVLNGEVSKFEEGMKNLEVIGDYKIESWKKVLGL